jgi:hypothetical protein
MYGPYARYVLFALSGLVFVASIQAAADRSWGFAVALAFMGLLFLGLGIRQRSRR